MLQVHTYRFNGHSPADPEHERGRKEEKAWARAEQEPLKEFEKKYVDNGTFTEDELKAARKEVLAEVKEAVKFAEQSIMPPVELAKELEYPDPADTDYNLKVPPAFADEVNARTISPEQMATVQAHIASLREKAVAGDISIGDAINLAIHEEMLRDPLPPFMLKIFRLDLLMIFLSSHNRRTDKFVQLTKLLTRDISSERHWEKP
jgi:hypothetical protein